jgi:hypothetical protein
LGYSPGLHEVHYPTAESGHRTIVAVATYAYNGQTHYASKFVTLDTFGPSSSDYVGDFDHDRVANDADLALWRENFGRSESGLRGESDGDYDVDGADFLAWQRGFGQTLVPMPALGGAPEPTAAALMAAGAAARLAARRRRRAVRPRRRGASCPERGSTFC